MENFKLKNIEKIKIKKDEKLLITIDVSGLDSEAAKEFMCVAQNYFEKKFKKEQIVLIPNNIKMSKIKIEK